MLELQVKWYWPEVSFVRVSAHHHMTLLQLKRMEKRFWCPQERRNPQKLQVQDVQNYRLLVVTLFSLICYKIFDVVMKLWLAKLNAARTFCFRKNIFFEIKLERLNLYVLEACLQENHAFILCQAFKTIHILEILFISINISSHTCDMLSSITAVCCCQHP